MTIMLCGEELILWGERTVDLPDIESSPVGGRCRVEVRRQIGEGHDGLALREGRDGPVLRQSEQARRGQASSQSLSTGDVFRHASSPGGPITNLRAFYLVGYQSGSDSCLAGSHASESRTSGPHDENPTSRGVCEHVSDQSVPISSTPRSSSIPL